MTKKQIAWIGMAVLTLLIFATTAFAQTIGDTDGDGVSNRVDRCPTVPGPPENNGCPLPDGGIPDRDGDGVADYVDQCPDQAGTGFNEGCPVEPAPNAPPVIQPLQPQIVMVWASTTECMVGVPLTSATGINVREQPTTSSAVIGHLAPGQQFAPYFRDYDENNAIWFGGAPAADGWGWVAGSVVIDNGQCASLPMIVHVDAPGAMGELILPPNLDALDLIDDRATPVPLPRVGWEVLIGAGDHPLIIEDDEQPSTERRGGDRNQYLIVTLKEVLITGVGPSGGGGGNPPPQPTSAPSPARPLPVLLVIADMYDQDCAAIDNDQCLVMAFRLPEFGNEPGQCSDASGEEKRRLSRLLEAALKGKVFKKVEIHGAARSAETTPQVMVTIDGDGSVVPVEQNEGSANWNYACAVVGFAPTGETEAMGDGSVRFIVDTVVLLPALPAVQ